MEITNSKPYITMVEDNNGSRLVNSYSTLEEAKSHISFQKSLGNKKEWSILHLKVIEVIKS